MSEDNTTMLLVIDHGKRPDWDALLRLANDTPVEQMGGYAQDMLKEFEGFPDGTPEDHVRADLVRAVEAFRDAWNDGKGSYNWEIRTVRGLDLHIVYDDPSDPVELWNDEAIIDGCLPNGFAVAGFDEGPEPKEAQQFVTALPLTQPEVQSLSEALTDTIEENLDLEPHMVEYAERLRGVHKRLIGVKDDA